MVPATLLLRIAAGIAALQGIAHGALFISAKPRHGEAELGVITAMKSNQFFRGGLGYWDYYFGYGLIAAAACLVEAALFWQLANVARTQAGLARPMVGLFVVANIAHAMLLVRYFRFPLPIAFDIILATVLAAAFVGSVSIAQAGA